MTEVKIPDDGGDTLTLIEHNGYLFPKFNVKAITGLSSVKIREDDILLLGYPKSGDVQLDVVRCIHCFEETNNINHSYSNRGNHWIWEITRQVLAGRIHEDDIDMTTMFMDKTPEETYESIQTPRILTSHTFLPQLPPDLVEKKPKMLNILRNPKDVAVSIYAFMRKLPCFEYNGQWRNFTKPFFHGKFCYGSWMDHVLRWEKVKVDYPDWPILSLYYEDFVEDAMRESRKLCRFLEVERSDDYLEKVCQQCAFDTMKKFKSTTEIKSLYFRKGQVGDWKNWFTVAENEWFDQLYQEKMKNCQLTFRYTLDS